MRADSADRGSIVHVRGLAIGGAMAALECDRRQR